MFKKLEESFKIFGRYNSGDHLVLGQHGYIKVFTKFTVSDEDDQKLHDLGWKWEGFWLFYTGKEYPG